MLRRGATSVARGGVAAARVGTRTFLQSRTVRYDISSRFGLAGTMNITAPDVDVDGALTVLDSSLAGAEARLLELCGQRTTRVGRNPYNASW